MRLLLVLLVAIVSSASAFNSFDNTCYRCEDFNPNGQGFMAHPNQTMCCYYYECWRVDGSTAIDGTLRTCPPGTWFNGGPGLRGAPCTASKPYDECVSQCGSSEPITRPMCHLYPNPVNAQQFGTLNPPPVGPWEYEGECRANFVFDHSSCTCIPLQLGSCHCKLDIDWVGGVEDDSCMKAHVINSDPNPVTVQADATVPDGSAGVFDGSNYLTIPMFSGLKEGDCYVGCFSYGLFFKPTASINPISGALIESTDCADETWKVFLNGGWINWEVGSQSTARQIPAPDTWYYTSVVHKYVKSKNIHSLRAYIMTVAQAIECQDNCNCPGPEVTVEFNFSCVEGRACGVKIGAGQATSYVGLMGRVQVAHKCHPMACSGVHCKKKGKRNRF